jgi:hypothetical protein
MIPGLTGPQQTTYDALFRQAVPRDLRWDDVWSMLGSIEGLEAVAESSGTLKLKRNGLSLVLRRPRGKELADAKELTQVRNFLERSGV